MRTLAIDCASEACSVAVFEGDALIAGDYRLLGRGHAEQLVPMIAALPDRGRAERIAVDIGPGSFTGIRVGLAAGKALALAWRAEIVGYGALALLAAMAREDTGEDDVEVAATGGHGEWFFQSFAGERGETPVSLRPDEAAARSRAPLIAGSSSQALVGLRQSGRALPLLPDARRFPLLSADALIAEPRPVYGRAPDARLPPGSA